MTEYFNFQLIKKYETQPMRVVTYNRLLREVKLMESGDIAEISVHD